MTATEGALGRVRGQKYRGYGRTWAEEAMWRGWGSPGTWKMSGPKGQQSRESQESKRAGPEGGCGQAGSARLTGGGEGGEPGQPAQQKQWAHRV